MSAVMVAGPATRWFGHIRKARGSTIAAAVIVIGFCLMAVLAPWISPYDPNMVDLLKAYAPPSADHWLGTDASGRDLLSRVITGAATSLIGPLLLVGLATAVSILLALTASWFGGSVDIVISRGLDVVLAIPGILIAIIAAAVFGPSLITVALALSVAYIPFIGRVLRAEATRHRRLPYVQATWLEGMSALRISTTQILPNLTPTLIAQVVLSLSYAVIDLAAMSYIGLGVQPPTADWGTMVQSGQTGVLQGAPAELIASSTCLVLLIVSLGILGDALSERAGKS